MSSLVTTDNRGRMTLGARSQTFRVTHLEDGALLLEPALALTETELAALRTPGFVEQIDASMARPDTGRRAGRRSSRTRD